MIALQEVHNRWLVAFSSAGMTAFAILGGACRLFLERLEPESRTILIPSTMDFAGLGVIVVLLLVGMAANVCLLRLSLAERRGMLALCVAGIAMAALLVITLCFGMAALRALGVGGMSLSGGD